MSNRTKLTVNQDSLSFAHEVLIYLLDVCDLSNSSEFDEGTFQIYRMIGRELSSRVSTNGSQGVLTARIASELGSRLDAFNTSWQLHCGLGMKILWATFRPVSARDLHQLESSNRAKDLANRFDALRWISGMSVRELCRLQRSIASIHDSIESASPPALVSLEVRKHPLLPGSIPLLTGVQDVQKALQELEHHSHIDRVNVSPYLEPQFEMLCQYKACAGEFALSEAQMELDLLAGRSTARYMRYGASSNTWEALSQIQTATAIGHPSMELAAVRNILPISMLHQLGNMNEVPLRSLKLLCSEIGSISRIVAESSVLINGEPLEDMKRLLLGLQETLFKALDCEVSLLEIGKTKSALDQLLFRTSHGHRDMNERAGHLHTSLERVFGRQQRDTPVAPTEQYEVTMCTSMDYVQFFTGCLILYVPDQPCDPALKPMVERDRHHKRRSELETKLQALQDFELVFSGQKSSLRSQLVERKIHELGAEPEVPVIFRPQISELGQLQAEFNNIVTSIILRSPTPETLQSVVQQEPTEIQEVEFLRRNIAQAISRLSKGFQAYEDITKPLVGFLQGLYVGLSLSLLTSSQQSEREKSMQCMCEMTPFLGAGPQGLAGITVADLNLYRLQNFDPRLHFLKYTGLARCAYKDLGEQFIQTMLQSFDSFYREWKEQLGRDQRHSAADSSLYRYRGSEEEINQADEQDFYSLFPDYSLLNKQDIASHGSTYDARDQAQRLALLQRGIFASVKSVSELLLALLQDASEDISRLWKDDLRLSRCPILAEKLFSALVISLDQHKERLLGQAVGGELYNFYSDANLSEARRLIALVEETQARFFNLREAWPEHATLADVLRTSSELLALRHTEPIAKILTKAEQLHGYIHEWQVIASTQYSAATVYDQLTDLLVSWRRLELSTWARLLDMEDQKCNKDADTWWFVAYEVIIAAPLCMVNEGEDLQLHVEQLFITLATFMETTSIGQYTHRLGMIDCFKSHLEILAQNLPSISVVHRAISNFLSYYTRFANPIQDHLRKGRQRLEKDMKEILLLASWKDNNINALRDSAKRSHHKLFKVIRKYRVLLAQSAETLVTQGFSVETDVFAPSKSKDSIRIATKLDPRVIQTCKTHLENWEMKPDRFKDPILTVQRMSQLSQLPPAAIDGVLYLDRFGADLIDSIKHLQKETPSKATKANGETVKHLKVRKRKLYAETLRALRHMGFRSNLGIDAIKKQSSTSMVLANTPAFATDCHPQLWSAELHFHRLLRLIPQIKDRSRNHTEDLSHSEVARSMGYLDGILFVILRQRSLLATAWINYQELLKTTKTVSNLWAPDSYTLEKQTTGLQKIAEEVHNAFRWLPAIIEAGSKIIEKHGQMGNIDHSDLLVNLGTWKGKITAANAALDQLPDLPSHLSSSRHNRTRHEAAGLLKDFSTTLRSLIENNLGLAYVLKQIARWANVDIALKNPQKIGGRPTSLVNVDNKVFKALSSILVAMQRMQEKISDVPCSDEDATWLISTESCLAESLRNLHPREINDLLREALDQIQYLGAASDGDVSAAGALFALALPIIQEYRSVVQLSFDRYAELHRALCKLAHHLAHSLSQVVQDGFCSPAETSAAEDGRTEKLEGGAGLGEGEGAEDISKDVQDEEDLSEVAQGMDTNKEKDEIENQEDAVNMNHDELEGEIESEMEDVSDKSKDDNSASEGEENDIDEETGDVDDLDPSAVDEKLWDGKAGEEEKEKEGSEDKGKVGKDGQVADEATNRRECAQVQDEEGKDDELSQNDFEEAEEVEVAQEETEKMNPHSQDGQKLDLPEEMDLDSIGGTDAGSVSGDSDMEGMSDVEQEMKEANSLSEGSRDDESEKDLKTEAGPQNQSEDKTKDNEDLEIEEAEEPGSPVDTEPDAEDLADYPGLPQDKKNEHNVEQEDSAPSDSIGLRQDVNQTDDEDPMSENRAQGKDGAPRNTMSIDEPQTGADDGQLGGLDVAEGGHTDENPNENRSSQAFKKLGDALEKWHRQIRQIQEAPETKASASPKPDVDMTNHIFEHLHDEETEADTQALGAASVEEARPLDRKAMDSEMRDEVLAFPPDETDAQVADKHDDFLNKEDPTQAQADQQQEQSMLRAFVARRNDASRLADQPDATTLEKVEDIDDLDNDLSATHLQPDSEAPVRSAEEARRLWSYYENLTRELSLGLTEQLRLILAPTLATKLRGDFRTGKRLNIKRIIPYIASQYKRDKIWMRRSIPSKRNYQIMLAVDDSKSMHESGSGQLAFETLALVSKSLSMLEVGEICVVGFGNKVNVAHGFDKPFTTDVGSEIFQQFGFQQNKTNVRKLIADSITLFREARRRSFNTGTELWQLELIISDGVCEDHETIRRLVRQAQDEQIMLVFIIVDALLKKESIMDMSQAVFEPDATGETKLKIKRYLDGFPFANYLVVGDVRELPGVLAQALRQWFAEVVETG